MYSFVVLVWLMVLFILERKKRLEFQEAAIFMAMTFCWPLVVLGLAIFVACAVLDDEDPESTSPYMF